MADLSRIRQALDKSISLGTVYSGRLQIEPKGAYIIRLIDNNKNVFMEAEIIRRNLICFKSFKLGDDSSNVQKVNFCISSNNYIGFSYGDDGIMNRLNAENANIFLEYNLHPVTVKSTTISGDTFGQLPSTVRTSFNIGSTYYLEKVVFNNSTNDDVTANQIATENLICKNFKTEIAELTINNNSTVSVPKLLVQKVAVEVMDVNTVNANTLGTSTIILSNIDMANSTPDKYGWEFKTIGNNNSDCYITLSTNNT